MPSWFECTNVFNRSRDLIQQKLSFFIIIIIILTTSPFFSDPLVFPIQHVNLQQLRFTSTLTHEAKWNTLKYEIGWRNFRFRFKISIFFISLFFYFRLFFFAKALMFMLLLVCLPEFFFLLFWFSLKCSLSIHKFNIQT